MSSELSLCSVKSRWSAKALVAAPLKLEGLLSWTVETKAQRGPVFALASSPDGRRLAAGGDDGVVRLWASATTRLPAKWLCFRSASRKSHGLKQCRVLGDANRVSRISNSCSSVVT